MKTYLSFFLLCLSTHGFSQTTHAITVKVNQPPVCTIVSLENISNSEFSVYPNPAKETISIKGIAEETQLEIHDAVGRKVLNTLISPTPVAVIDMNFLGRGIYSLRLRTGRKFYQTKLVLD